MAPYTDLNTADPISTAIRIGGAGKWLEEAVDVAAVVGLFSTVLVTFYGQTRIFMRMSSDGMLPPAMGRVSERFKTPVFATVSAASSAASSPASSRSRRSTNLVSIGTLLAFLIVCCGVLYLRRARPDLERPFRVPAAPLTAGLRDLRLLRPDGHPPVRHLRPPARLAPPALDLSTLNGANGFKINGEAVDDRAGRSVGSAGDVNGDGFDDLVIGAAYADPNGLDSGTIYVVFGKGGAFSPTLELSTLNGANGFKINGAKAADYSGRSVSGAGDVNGDDFDDLLIGANRTDPNGPASGASYVVFGKGGGFAPTFNLSTLNGANGFKINGAVAGDQSGLSVSTAGDVNGDGVDDLLIGAGGADPNGSDSGASYVLFGRGGAFSPTLEISTLNGIERIQDQWCGGRR